ncbi:Xanthine/uracil/vitamin C permease [Kalmanozyma brasiliensis GHG001]|uniref:Purine permease n=1 Tax=Kalmanozyma brasiliensis (strain GHG001) TaxID=1365824 RepID=V5EP51_KALBG|nr:Xanthine/uracil/vitamin C permease [Kalmanozyma brasiliensis GHG001]EST06880.1 Xanthine/uracil/vitamin C permease [Kalmanozyma brasiliensis GHG001]
MENKPSITVEEGSLASLPASPSRSLIGKVKRGVRALGTKKAWFGDHNYVALFTPTIPFVCKPSANSLPFYSVDAKLPIFLAIVLGLQHSLAMVGGVVTPPLLIGGSAGANLGQSDTQFLIASTLIWCAFGTALQVSRSRLFKTKYYLGTGIVSVTGASFATISIALSFFSQSYANGYCPVGANGVKLPCPQGIGAFLGTCCLCGIIAIFMAFIPPKAIRKLFPPLIVGMMLTLIGASLVKSGITNWAGGSGPCATNHAIKCTIGSRTQYWGSAPLIGLGFVSFATIILCEIFGSPFLKSASVFVGLVVGMIVAAATGYFNSATIAKAPTGSFLWTKTYPLSIKPELILPLLAAYIVIVAETVGNVTASCDASRLPMDGTEFESRIQGGMLADSISATLAGLAMVPPLTTFSQNSGVISLTRNASRTAGFVCAAILFLMGVIGKFSSLFVAMPSSVLGGFTTFLFGSVAVAGIRIMAYAKWDRRARFIATAGMSLGLASLTVPSWFSYFFTYKGSNAGLKGLIQAIVLIVEEPYLISSVLAILLNAVLPAEMEDEVPAAVDDDVSSNAGTDSKVDPVSDGATSQLPDLESGEEAQKRWNQPGTFFGSK